MMSSFRKSSTPLAALLAARSWLVATQMGMERQTDRLAAYLETLAKDI